MLRLFRALVLSLVVLLLTPVAWAGGPVGSTSVVVEAFVAGERVNVGTAATILARVRDSATNSFITGDALRLQIAGGSSMVASISDSGYVRSASANSITMDHICYSRTTGTSTGDIINRSRGSFGAVMIARYGEPCATNYIDTGWYIAKMYAPLLIERDESQYLSVTDLSVKSSSTANFSTVVVNRIGTELDQIQALPLSPNVAMGNDMPVILFATSRGIGLNCLPGTNSYESDAESGCTSARNGFEVANDRGININQATLSRNSRGTLSMTGVVSGLRLFSRAISTTKSSLPLSVSNLGGGAYMVIVRGGNTLSSSYASINATDDSGARLSVSDIILNVTDPSWKL